MDTSKLKKFAQFARRYLLDQVAAKQKFVLATDSQARRENLKAVEELEKQIRSTSKELVIEKAAYIWFNRFCAIRFMDVNRYTRIGILSPAEGQFQPEILAEAKMGHIDEDMVPEAIRMKVFDLLSGSTPSRDPQAEAYHLLVVASCNYYNKTMPFMFEKIADYTELLIPDDLLSGNSILAYTREAMTPDICQDVEVIGWLYQFYISEKKDEVFEGLKKNKKITPENIPAATQLFTPHWIVRYLVENSLGRLWMLNRPNSRLIDQMLYYIKPETPETDFLQISRPEEIKLCDPACGSGHMLTYSYDLLYVIYEEEGYDANEIPRLILENNLFGIEIDERAGELAAFALTMKAAKGNPRENTSNYRRFFRNPVQPNICILQNILFKDGELNSYMDAVGSDLFTMNLQTMLHQFREADNFGSLIRPVYADAASILRIVKENNLTSDLFLQNTHERVLLALKQAAYLSPKYHVVVANPPYMGAKGMNGRLASWAKDNYSESKSDLFAMFMVRSFDFLLHRGYLGMINLPSWLFLTTFEELRNLVINNYFIESMLHMGRGIFGIDWGSTAFIVKKNKEPQSKGHFFRLHKRNFQHLYYYDIERLFLISKNSIEYKYDFDEYRDEEGVNKIPEKSNDNGIKIYYKINAAEFRNIPGSPIAYWATKTIFESFNQAPPISSILEFRKGMGTGDNDSFVRNWHEVSNNAFKLGVTSVADSVNSGKKWFPYNNGGGFRKWYGNNDTVVNWHNDGIEVKARATELNNGGHWSRYIVSTNRFFEPGLTWTAISSTHFGVRRFYNGFLFSSAAMCGFGSHYNIDYSIALLNSKVSILYLKFLAPTLNFGPTQVQKIPYKEIETSKLINNSANLLSIAQSDWDSFETSWNFNSSPLLISAYHNSILKSVYTQLRAHWQQITQEMQSLEEENNRIFIDAYGLKDELTPDVSLNEITLNCNPYYRYGNEKNNDELDGLLFADTMKEFISYAVGCMFGRYSLDKPGLMLSNQGETIENYFAKVPDPTFEPDDDNVIPILDEGWFTDDITERFRKFLKITFGEEHYEENLNFLEEAIGKDIRKFFLKDFYTDHLKRYKKRPIYWLFSSPKGSFNALIYMHRYRPDTVSVVLNDYLREFRTKLSARKEHLEQISISASASPREKTQALKDLEKLRKVIDELDEYERETLYPLATKQIAIDLDDGVKVNYLKFGDALRKIPGLDAGEE